MPDKHAFVADVAAPIRIRLHLSHTGIDRSSIGALDWLGWELVANKIANKQELIYRDHWVETLLEAMALAGSFSTAPLRWRWAESAKTADLLALQPGYDASRRFQSAIRSDVSPDGDLRLCFNAYDDGCFRFTVEQRVECEQLQAWVPRSWSSEHPDLRGAEEEARGVFRWLN